MGAKCLSPQPLSSHGGWVGGRAAPASLGPQNSGQAPPGAACLGRGASPGDQVGKGTFPREPWIAHCSPHSLTALQPAGPGSVQSTELEGEEEGTICISAWWLHTWRHADRQPQSRANFPSVQPYRIALSVTLHASVSLST